MSKQSERSNEFLKGLKRFQVQNGFKKVLKSPKRSKKVPSPKRFKKGPQRPKQVHKGQKKSIKVQKGSQRSKKVQKGPKRFKKIQKGQNKILSNLNFRTKSDVLEQCVSSSPTNSDTQTTQKSERTRVEEIRL